MALVPGATPLRPPDSLEAKILEERPGIEGERKQVTVMYTDIVGSMALTRALDNERYGYLLDRFLALAAAAVHELEGTVNQFTGDGLLAVFGAPLAHEDHARRACLAVLRLQAEAAELAAEMARSDGVEFSIRCGVNSGEVVVGAIGDDVHMDFVPIGNTTALGKRIESLAPPGSAAISGSTAALVEGEFELRGLGEFELKGVEGRQRVLELLGPSAARTRIEAMAATRGLSPFVGREAETAELETALDEALAGNGGAVAIVGDPGVGKSRLVSEFAARCRERGLTVNSTTGFAHARHVPFRPMLALYRDYFGIAKLDVSDSARDRIETTMLALDPAFAADLPLLFDYLGVPDPDRPPPALEPEERQRRLLSLMTRSVEVRSRNEAAVLVIEDLHWVDDASAAFIDHLREAVAGTRLLLVTTFRPEYEPAWAAGGPDEELQLGPLDPDGTNALLAVLLGGDRSLDGLPELIGARADGNPFFVEEIVQALAENGHLSGSPGNYRLASELDGLVLPATVEAGLAARIDRLPVREKALVQTMSVIGTEVAGPLLRAVSDLDESELGAAVEALAGAQLIVQQGSADAYSCAFKHPLTQDVAYGSLLSEPRARAHQRVASALASASPGELDEHAALVAHHWESAGEDLRAAGWHARAAAWVATTSPPDGMRHWRRVRQLTDGLGDSAEATALATEAGTGILQLAWQVGMSPEEIAAIGAEGVLLEPHYAGFVMHNGRELEGLEAFRAIYRNAVETGDDGRAVIAATGVAYSSWISGSLHEGAEAVEHAIALATAEPALGADGPFVSPLAHALGDRAMARGYMGDLEAARADFERGAALARERDDPQTHAHNRANLALLEESFGETEAALHNAASGLESAEQMGDVIGIIAATTPAAVANADAGRFAEALTQAAATLDTVGERQIGRYFEPLLLATIAQAKLALGEPDEALAAAEEAVAVMEARRLATCALRAPITLAQVLLATQGAAAGERIETVLAGAERVIETSGARVFTLAVERERAALAQRSA